MASDRARSTSALYCSGSLDNRSLMANTGSVSTEWGNIMISKADIFILLGVTVSFVLGVYLFFTGNREQGLFAATWVPAILAFGIYFKLLVRKPKS